MSFILMAITGNFRSDQLSRCATFSAIVTRRYACLPKHRLAAGFFHSPMIGTGHPWPYLMSELRSRNDAYRASVLQQLDRESRPTRCKNTLINTISGNRSLRFCVPYLAKQPNIFWAALNTRQWSRLDHHAGDSTTATDTPSVL